MKRMRVLFLAMCLLAALTACEAKTVPVVRHSMTPTATPTAAPTPSLTPTPEETPVPEKEFSHGVWEGNTFTSEYAEAVFAVPDDGNWLTAGYEDIEQDVIDSTELTGSNMLEEAAAEMSSMQDMLAENTATGASVILIYEDLVLSGRQNVTVAEYAQSKADGLTVNGEYEYEVRKVERYLLCGKDYLAMHTAIPEYDFYQCHLLRREGDRMIVFILTAPGENGIEELLSMFAGG